MSSTFAATVEWTRQLGTAATDRSQDLTVDEVGNVYIAGDTQGSLVGTNSGGNDTFLTKFTPHGDLEWTRQLGSTGNDQTFGVSADGMGSVYMSGLTQGALGAPNGGGHDAFVSKWDTVTGNLLWIRQLGTASQDGSLSVSADRSGSVFITGYTDGNLGGSNVGSRDVFFSKYDSTGELSWTRQFGSALTDYGLYVAGDGAGNVYLTGNTTIPQPPPFAALPVSFLSKYDALGGLVWTRKDTGGSIAVDGLGNVHTSTGKYNSLGEGVWIRERNLNIGDAITSVAADMFGNSYISGYTFGSLSGQNAGAEDAFVIKYDADGNILWTVQLGTASREQSLGVSATTLGDVYISGWTEGNLGGPNLGNADAFVAKVGCISGSTCSLAGDYNDDGIVNAADYTVWRDTDGSPEGLTAWQRNFGLAYGIGSSELQNAAVPEPTAWQLLLGMVLTVFFLARRFR
ncbi:MAG: SBBP repeat-containing protein [Pirellulales bacterium]